MVNFFYAQEHDQNSRKISCRYFYVRNHSLNKFDWRGEWDLAVHGCCARWKKEQTKIWVSIKTY